MTEYEYDQETDQINEDNDPRNESNVISNDHYKREAEDYLNKSIRLSGELHGCLMAMDNEDLSDESYNFLNDVESSLRKEIQSCDDMVDHYNSKIDWSL